MLDLLCTSRKCAIKWYLFLSIFPHILQWLWSPLWCMLWCKWNVAASSKVTSMDITMLHQISNELFCSVVCKCGSQVRSFLDPKTNFVPIHLIVARCGCMSYSLNTKWCNNMRQETWVTRQIFSQKSSAAISPLLFIMFGSSVGCWLKWNLGIEFNEIVIFGLFASAILYLWSKPAAQPPCWYCSSVSVSLSVLSWKSYRRWLTAHYYK